MDVCMFNKPSALSIIICKKFYELPIMVLVCVFTLRECSPGSRLFIGDKMLAGPRMDN